MSRRVLIVDGYNVVRQTPPYRDLAERDLECARTALVSDVAAYAAGEWEATVVFDGGANVRSDGQPHRVMGVTVIFSKYGMEADAVIEIMSRAARVRGAEVEVVTSDAQTQWAVLGGGVVRRSSGEFADSLRATEGEWREHMSKGGARGRVENQLDPAVTERLARWARGLP